MGEGRGGGAQRIIHLALADSFTLFRIGLRIVIDEAQDFAVSEAGSLEGLATLLSAAPPPDLALVDLDLPPTGAADAVTLLRQNDVLPIVWARRDRLSPNLVFGLVRAGAIGGLAEGDLAGGTSPRVARSDRW